MSKVYLIGAGPGDEQLITLKAIKVLEKCTAVLYDRLANNSLLRYLNKGCAIYYCGKEPGCHYKSQEQINDMMVELAKQGHIVGRIKGGDPYIFGRGGEEALRLYDEGIEFEVIPGITSAISVLNYAGIPATHRGIAQSFHVFTGKSMDKLDISWEAAAKLKGTLIFLMGLENIELIVSQLIENGKKTDCPAAVIMNGTTARQKKVIGTIGDICTKARSAGFKSPCIIVIGEVVALSEKLTWFEKKPLFGCNVCITRSKEQAKETRDMLLELGAEVTEINTIGIKPTPEEIEPYIAKLSNYKYIVFTSVNGVNIFFDYLRDINFDIRNINSVFAAIGPSTAEAIKNRGIIPSIMGAEFVAEDLFDALKTQVQAGDSILIPRSKEARTFIVDKLMELGCLVDEAHVYEIQKGQLIDQNYFNQADYVVFTSPTTVKNLIAMIGLDKIKQKINIAIGPITNNELIKHDIQAYVCEEYSVAGIISKLKEIRGEKHV
jgi:uroporphyrinogen III methyltransferase/synthase